jgi:hypothetical protein
MTAPIAPATCGAPAADAATVPPRLVAVVVCDGREIPIYAARPMTEIAAAAVVCGKRSLAQAFWPPKE